MKRYYIIFIIFLLCCSASYAQLKENQLKEIEDYFIIQEQKRVLDPYRVMKKLSLSVGLMGKQLNGIQS